MKISGAQIRTHDLWSMDPKASVLPTTPQRPKSRSDRCTNIQQQNVLIDALFSHISVTYNIAKWPYCNF